MGATTLAEIRAELRRRYEAEFKDPVKWFNEEIRRLQKTDLPDRSGIKLLKMMRDSLFGKKKKPATTRKKVH